MALESFHKQLSLSDIDQPSIIRQRSVTDRNIDSMPYNKALLTAGMRTLPRYGRGLECDINRSRQALQQVGLERLTCPPVEIACHL